MGEKRHAYRILVGKPEGKGPLGRPRRRQVGNIKMDLREIGWYPEPDEYTLQYLILFNIHYNIILPSTSRSSKCMFPSGSSTKLLNITIETIKILLTVT
jgi:hypothetical protein